MAEAVLIGSIGSGGGGARDVFTEQNLHPLVHWSPNTYYIFISMHMSDNT